jgi:hypothetical protein
MWFKLHVCFRGGLLSALLVLSSAVDAQTATSATFSLESSLPAAAGRATSSSFSTESCLSAGPGGISGSANFALTTGCGAMTTLSVQEASALGIELASTQPVAVPVLSSWVQLVLLVLMLTSGALASKRRGRRGIASQDEGS